MGQILQFPKEKSKRVTRALRKKNSRQGAFLTLSVFSFILIAVFSNEQMMKNQRPVYLISDNSPRSLEQVNRAIASAQPMNMFRDIEWEHRLAERLGQTQRVPASTSQKLTMMDHLRYGVLAGKYRIISKGSELNPSQLKLSEIEYIDSLEISDRPVQIEDHQRFLSRHADLLPEGFAKSVLQKNERGEEVWSLLSHDGKRVGTALMRFDDNGNFLGLKVQPEHQDGSLSERVSSEE